MATSPSFKISSPPQGGVPLDDPSWARWFQEVVWPLIGAGWQGSGPQGTFPQLQVGRARWTSQNAFQDLINVDQGIYVNYFSNVESIIYGFACNVHRAAGGAFVVGAQINAWGEAGSTGNVWALATTALNQPFSGTRNLVVAEHDILSQSSPSTGVKWAINPVFKDRFDGLTATTEGLGSNFYNYFAEGIVFTSQPRSTAGEFCGWSVGMDFLDGWCDQSSVLAWNNATTYSPGMVVSSGGVLWKAIQTSLNQLPAGGSLYWVQRTYAGVNNLAVGIDFSSMGVGAMALMASALRLRSTMYVHWEESGAVGTKFDPVTSILHLVDNQGALRFGVNVASGLLLTSLATDALGGGAAATLGTIGGTGPTVAAQNSWGKLSYNGVTYWVPLWL